MPRADDGLPFLLKYENVARYEDGQVLILDRRKYPASVEFVRCAGYQEVAQAITDMATQSGGPWLAAAWGMVATARLVKGRSSTEASAALARAAQALAHARPTRVHHMATHVDSIRLVAEQAIAKGTDAESAARAFVEQKLEQRYLRARAIGAYTADLLPNPCSLLTQCFAETLIGFTLLVAQQQGKHVSLWCPETRPYLQGSRLTASVAYDMGVPVTVITDNMPAFVMSQGKIDVYVSAADVITLDGHVVNKVGTFQIATAAHYHGIPYYAQGNPTPDNATISTVTVEERNPEETVHVMGIRTAKTGVQGYYPAFDVTPPHLVSAVVTDHGVFSPFDLRRQFSPRLSDVGETSIGAN